MRAPPPRRRWRRRARRARGRRHHVWPRPAEGAAASTRRRRRRARRTHRRTGRRRRGRAPRPTPDVRGRPRRIATRRDRSSRWLSWLRSVVGGGTAPADRLWRLSWCLPSPALTGWERERSAIEGTRRLAGRSIAVVACPRGHRGTLQPCPSTSSCVTAARSRSRSLCATAEVVSCPHCSSSDVRRLLSRFAVHSSSPGFAGVASASSGKSCSSCASSSCATCH